MIQVTERPGSFSVREGLHKGLRSAQQGHHLIFFLVTSNEVQIVRVLHRAQGLPRIFDLNPILVQRAPQQGVFEQSALNSDP